MPAFRSVRRAALAMALPVAALGAWSLAAPDGSALMASGRIQAGHVGLACADCHQPAAGTIRQQLQARARWLVGLRTDAVDFGRQAVGSAQCLDCHERPNERHPVFRFNEPRFADALFRVAANDCLGCHGEHDAGHRLVSDDLTFCSACHGGLVVRNDPLDTSHAALIEQKRWSTCLGCHDFHGNHAYKPPVLLADVTDPTALKAYLRDAPDPYGPARLFPARNSKEDRK